MVKKVKFVKEKLDLIIKHNNISEVARKLNINISPLRRYYNRCIREGFLIKENREYSKGSNYRTAYHHERSNQKGQIEELHGTRILIPIINPSTNWKKEREIFMNFGSFQSSLESYKPNDKIYPRQVQYDFKDIEFFHINTTSKSIILIQKKDKPITIELSKQGIISLKERLMNLVFGLIPKLEKKFMERLSGEFETEIKLTRQHYAFLKNPLANSFIDEKLALKVYVDGELRTIVDKSKGIIHFEDVHPKESPLDAQAHERFIHNINTGNFNEEKVVDDLDTVKGKINGLNELINNKLGIMEELKDVTLLEIENKKLHQNVLVEMKDTLKEIKNNLNFQNISPIDSITYLIKNSSDILNPEIKNKILTLDQKSKQDLEEWFFEKFGQ